MGSRSFLVSPRWLFGRNRTSASIFRPKSSRSRPTPTLLEGRSSRRRWRRFRRSRRRRWASASLSTPPCRASPSRTTCPSCRRIETSGSESRCGRSCRGWTSTTPMTTTTTSLLGAAKDLMSLMKGLKELGWWLIYLFKQTNLCTLHIKLVSTHAAQLSFHFFIFLSQHTRWFAPPWGTWMRTPLLEESRKRSREKLKRAKGEESGGIQTHDLHITRHVLYHCALPLCYNCGPWTFL